MAEKLPTKKYQVKAGCYLYHGGDRFDSGSILELVDAVYEVHKDNLDPVIEEPTPPKQEAKKPDEAKGEP